MDMSQGGSSVQLESEECRFQASKCTNGDVDVSETAFDRLGEDFTFSLSIKSKRRSESPGGEGGSWCLLSLDVFSFL